MANQEPTYVKMEATKMRMSRWMCSKTRKDKIKKKSAFESI